MKKRTLNSNVLWLFAILLSTISVHGMEPERDMMVNQSEIDRTSSSCLSDSDRAILPNAYSAPTDQLEVAKSYLWSTASLWGGLLLITTGGPISGTLLCAYGAVRFFSTLEQQEREEQMEVCIQQAAKQGKCCIFLEDPNNSRCSMMDIPCTNIQPDRICKEDQKNRKEYEQQISIVSRIQSLPKETRVHHIAGYLTAKEKNILMQVCKDSNSWLKNDRKALLKANSSTITKRDKVKSMYEYIVSGDNEMISFLIKAGVDVNGADLNSYPSMGTGLNESLQKAGVGRAAPYFCIFYIPLHIALQVGRSDTIQLLLDAGANINCSHPYNGANSILHLASEDGDIATIKSAIKLGADVNQANGNYQRPLHIASASNCVDVVKTLFFAGAHIHQRYNGDFPLHIASDHGNIEIVKFLLSISKAYVNQDGNFGTPLYIAVAKGRTEVVQLLLQAGANIHQAITDNHWDPMIKIGDTVLQIAQKKGHTQIVELIEEHMQCEKMLLSSQCK